MYGLKTYIRKGNRPWNDEDGNYWNDTPLELIELAKNCCNTENPQPQNAAEICTTLTTIIQNKELERVANNKTLMTQSVSTAGQEVSPPP